MIDLKPYKNFRDFVLKNKRNITKNKEKITFLQENTQFLDKSYENVKLIQRLWHFYNKIDKIQICKQCNKLPVKLLHQSHINYKNNIIYSDYCNDPICNENLRKQTFIKKYGVDNPLKSKKIREQIKQTNLKRYGVDNPTKSEKIQQKIKQTNLERYGVDNVFKSKEIQQQIKQTNLKRYGVDNPFKSDIIKEKIKQTFLRKYSTEKYCRTPEIIEKYNKTIRKKYNADTFWKSDYYLNQVNENLTEIIENLNYKNIKIFDNKISLQCPECNEISEIDKGLLYSRIQYSKTSICTKCNPKNSSFVSDLEKEFSDYIESLGVKIENSNREILNGFEMDIFVPNKNVAFEFNGIYWHSENKKKQKYHQIKKIVANQNGINLIHIWEDDWNFKQEIIKSRIKNILGLNEIKIYGRQCKIKQIYNTKVVKDFLNENHLQGYVNSKWKYGLYKDDELVSIICVGKRNDVIEVLRFCNKLNTSVIGAFSKLFKHFLKEHDEIKEIISYADLDWSDFKNNLYFKNGFEQIEMTVPGYFWSNGLERFNRQKFQKHKLIKEGFDKNKTEDQIMKERGFMKVYNSGNLKYKYIK